MNDQIGGGYIIKHAGWLKRTAALLLTLVIAFAAVPEDAFAQAAETESTVSAELTDDTSDDTVSDDTASDGEGADSETDTEDEDDSSPDEDGADQTGEKTQEDADTADVQAEDDSDSEDEELETESDETVTLTWSAHIQTYGWTSGSGDASNIITIGTTGQAKRLEAVTLNLTSSDGSTTGSIQYRTHVQTYGWQSTVADGATAGTTGLAKRMEAIQISLTGDLANTYDVYYRVHVQTYGWLGWTKNGGTAGTTGLSKRAEAIQIVLVEKGGSAPGSTSTPYVNEPTLSVQTHMQTYGWLSSVGSGTVSGKAGSKKRLEAMKLTFSSSVSGSISYSTHVQSTGWQSYVSSGSVSGTTGQAKRAEAIKIQLTGNAASYYDIWYRVYIQGFGWLDWASNGAVAGTTSMSCRIEAIQVKIQAKGTAAPGSTSKPYISGISGDGTLDKYLMTIYDTKGTNLKTLFNYVASYKYIRTSGTPSGSWSTWSVSYAKQMYENQGGNCYRFASLFCWLARGLGYDAKTISGYCPSRSSGWAVHGWVEIVINGTTYVYDPDMAKSYPSYNWYQMTYSSAPITYKK